MNKSAAPELAPGAAGENSVAGPLAFAAPAAAQQPAEAPVATAPADCAPEGGTETGN